MLKNKADFLNLKSYFIWTLLSFLVVNLAQSSEEFDRYLQTIDGREAISAPIKELLYEEQILHNKALWGEGAFSSNIRPEYIPEARPKFPLPYFLVPAEDASLLKSNGHDPNVMRQISKVGNNGARFHKLFVHPESYEHYRFLEGHYEFVGPSQTEFMASPTSSYRSLVVWNKSGEAIPFIAKVSLDRNIIGNIDRLVSQNEVERSITNQEAFEQVGRESLRNMGLDIFPESAGLILEKNIPGRPEKLGGQLIREIPASIRSGEMKWISLSAMMSPNRMGLPMVMEVIQKSGLSANEFITRHLINNYMSMFEQVSLQRGLNFEPHSQNLLFETDRNLRPTGKWVIRDFGGVWPDMITMMESTEGPVEAYLRDGNAKKFKFKGGHSNAFASYAFFYKRQVFDKLLTEISKYDPSVTPMKMAQYKAMIDARMGRLVSRYLLQGREVVPSSRNYRRLLEERNRDTPFPEVNGEAVELTREVKDYIQNKKSLGEWVSLSSEVGVVLKVNKYGSFMESMGGRLVGFGFFNQEEFTRFSSTRERNINNFLRESINQRSGGISSRCIRGLRSIFH